VITIAVEDDEVEEVEEEGVGSMNFVHSIVVKHKLYSCIIDGYKELKSRSSMYVSYNPFFGSNTRPPAYAALLLDLQG
jgi:hypothetical protein